MADTTKPTETKKVAEPEVLTIADSTVMGKYKDAAIIANTVLDQVIKLCVVDAKAIDICIAGDKAINEATKKIYNKGKNKVTKGIAFPTTVSINNCVAHFSPLPSDPESKTALKEGDVVKIQLGVQIDGYGSTVATTLVVGANGAVTGSKADVIQAARTALEAAVRMIRPGNKNMEVTKTVDKIAESYNVKAVEGMLTHNQLQNKTDGEKQIILNPTDLHLRDFKRVEFAENEVYAIDILISSGEGKVRPLKTRTTVYKKTGVRYQLKMAASRAVFSEIQTKAGAFPFSLRDLEDERKARMGIVEAAKHQTVLPYDVMYERDDAVVAQYMTTLLVTKNGNIMATNPRFDAVEIKSDKEIKDEEILKLLASPYEVPKKK
ncbi:proliferation-associated protein 1 [Backusella circina FSU 941]|nr:proliferation-associated protein 1 [Backusella circina FSU 941]KAI8882741.1 proliferation-associated protein 1 [Backusella circina FSU 941]